MGQQAILHCMPADMKVYSNDVNRIDGGFLFDIQIPMTYFDSVAHGHPISTSSNQQGLISTWARTRCSTSEG
jgi:hypothetical protein